MQGPGGGTAAQTLHSQRAAHLWWVGCGHGGDAAAWLVGAGKLLDRHRGRQGGITEGLEVLRWCGVIPASRSANPSTWDRANSCPHG